MAFSQAKEQAEKEILKTFAITDKISTPEKVSLTDNSKDAAILLAISSIMLYDKSEAEFSEFTALSGLLVDMFMALLWLCAD